MPVDCACDEERPETIDDCEAGEILVCMGGVANHEGIPLSEVVPFQCSCVPEQDYCDSACRLAFPEYSSLQCLTDQPQVLCGCAVVVLR
jgi:hypothetical protein